MSSINIPADLPIFNREDNRLIPTHLATGPWYPGTQHGSAMLLMAALAAEQAESEIPRQVTRMTVDMMSAAPLAPIDTRCEVRKSGRNLDTVDISLQADGKECVRASAMRFRTEDIEVSEVLKYQGPVPSLPRPLPEAILATMANEEGFHHAIEIRLDVKTQPAVMWFRLKQPVLPDLPATPFLRVALAADWTYSIPVFAHRFKTGNNLASEPYFGINPDTTINLHRPALGEWIAIQTLASFGDLGAGTVMGQIFDEQGPLGFSTQSVLVRKR